MATAFEPTGEARQPDPPAPILEAPFLESPEVPWSATSVTAVASSTGEAPFLAESPFVSEYVLGERTVRPEEPALHELLEELYDAEFDEAISDLVAEAENYVAELGLGESETDQVRAEQMLQAWADPLRRETEAVLIGLAEAYDSEGSLLMAEEQLDAIFERFESADAEYGPAFEGFLKSIVNKARKIAQGAIKAAKSGINAVSRLMPIGIILRKLAALARPLLTRVLKFSVNKLPLEYRDPAKLLARRFLGIEVTETEDELDGEDLEEADWEPENTLGSTEQPATADVRQIQDAFDAEAVGLVFAPSEQEQDLYLAEASVSSAASAPLPLAALDAARTRFVDGMKRLDESADPTPLVENFLPAILPALRLGLRIAGRPRVVRFLSQYLGRLIAPYVGPSVTPGLSRAIVDAGLRAMTLEAGNETNDGTEAVAAEAFASLVEDTVARVAQLDEADLAHDLLVEEAAYTAFQEAAAATFPGEVLSPQNEYLESGRARGTWVAMPRGGPWRYRKYSHVFNVVIHPSAARAITTFGGRPLSAFIRDRSGRSGPIRARVHLYQAVPGSSLVRIARAERGVAGLGSSALSVRSRFHPLTPMAAAALVGEPGLGREVSEAYDGGTGPLAIGQRLYYLEVPNTTAMTAATAADSASAGDADADSGTAATAPAPARTTDQPRSSDARADINPAGGNVTVTIYASEADAQAIATRLRRRESLGASLASLRRIYGPALGTAIGARRAQRIRVRSEAEGEGAYEVETEDYLRGQARFGRQSYARRHSRIRPLLARRRAYGARPRRPRHVRRRLLVSWIARALAAELDRSRDAFLRAADAPADGVTIVLRLRPPGLRALMTTGAVQVAAAAGPGPVQVEIRPGPPRV
ncbi:hypothetical protein [Streptomyces umbrinus]|uniref:hypothetical protein n=1 Tax=Streptomyces umbrinus TaxID=67370 RepID=UPI0033D9A29D